MMTKTILGMTFDAENMPDFGSIEMDKRNEYLHLCGADIDKLNMVLTRSACIGTYGADKFPFSSGDVAIVDDTQRAFVYNSTLDTWTEWLML